MKTRKRAFERVADFENLLAAYRKARRGKREKAAVFGFDFRREEELLRLQAELLEDSYRPGPYRSFPIFEPKRRVIGAARGSAEAGEPERERRRPRS